VACVHPDDRARVIAACGRCAAEGADFDEEFRVVWPDGSLHWLDDKGRTFRDGEGRPWYMTGACVEVTERRRVAEALGESEARLRRIMDSGIVGVFFWSLAGGILEANDKFLEMMGYTRADLAAGRIDWRSMTPPEYAASDAEKVAELTTTGAHGPYEK
jgi:PAS domain-containing protein